MLLVREIPSAALLSSMEPGFDMFPSVKPSMLSAGTPITVLDSMLRIVFVPNPHLLVRLAKNIVHMLVEALICLEPLSHAEWPYVLLACVCKQISASGACVIAMLPAEAVSKPRQIICSPVLRNVGLLYV
jgi:hypothetical protein